jgi:PTH1 family peptidyl-tRNA hydrolase
MFLVVGLGNPDKEYQATRHNVGFMAADEIFRRHSFSDFKKKAQGLVAQGEIANEKILLAKPMTYMNLSGNCVAELVNFYKIPLKNVIVIHDDMDLAVGQVKAKCGGGAAGHNGLKSIDSHIGNAYNRIRIGVGRPQQKEQVVDWVLSKFNKEDQTKIEKMLDLIAENIDIFISRGWQDFASIIGEKTNGI